MDDNLNNNQIDFYQNQMPQNQGNLTNITLRQERKEASFEVDNNFLQSSFNKFLEQKFQQIQNKENMQVTNQIQNVLQVMGQQINNLRNDLDKAFAIQEDKIISIDASKNEVTQKCIEFYDKWKKENSKNIENFNEVYKVMDENNNRIVNDISCQSKKLDDSIMNNKLENDKFKNDFNILKNDLNLARSKNIQENFNDNYKKTTELEARLINLENHYRNNKELSIIKTNIKDFETQIKNNSNNISEFENKFKKYKEINDKNLKDLQKKINEMNDQLYTKVEEITNEINKMKNDITNKKFESIKLKDDKTNSKILDYLKEQLNEFIENNNKKVDEIKSKHIKDIDNINNKLTEDLDKLNKECDNKINNNLNKLKNNFEKIEKDFQIQNNINLSHEKSIEDIKNKINDNKLIIQNMNNKNDNKNKIVIENKKIVKFEMEKDKPKIYRMSQWNNQISFKDITNEFEDNKTVEKIKIAFKKDEDEKDKIIYEVHNIQKDWDFKRHIKNMFKRLNKAREIKKINLNKLKHVYILKFTDNQIHFIKKEAILNFVKNNNYYVKIRNNFVFVNNKRRKYFNNRKWNNNNFNFRKNNYINNNGNNRNNNFRNNNSNGRNNKNNFNNNRSNNQMNKSSNRRNQMNNNRSNNNNRYNNNRRFNNSNRRNNFNNRKYYNNRNRFNKRNF